MTSRVAYLALLGALLVERLIELSISRAHVRAALAHGAIEAGRGHFPFMVLLHSAFFVSCFAEVFVLDRPFPGLLGFAALVFLLLAQVLRYSAIVALGERWSVRIIVWPNRGPVTTGPYRWIKHPNYVAVVVELLCLPLVHGAWITALAFSIANAAVLAVRVREEERALGPTYADAFRGRGRRQRV